MAGEIPKMQHCPSVGSLPELQDSIQGRDRKTKEGNMENDFHTGDT